MKSDPNNANSFSHKMRLKRAKFFAELVEALYSNNHTTGNLTILDIGGTVAYWKNNAQYLPASLIKHIEIVNLPPAQEQLFRIADIDFRFYAADALNTLTLKNASYDIVYSNSVIEHVGSLYDQRLFANNIHKIADYYFIQTPSKNFPIEPHFVFPFFNKLPLSVRAKLHNKFSLGHMLKEPDYLQAVIDCEQTRLLSKGELQNMFPNASIFPERFMGMVKSWMVTNIC